MWIIFNWKNTTHYHKRNNTTLSSIVWLSSMTRNPEIPSENTLRARESGSERQGHEITYKLLAGTAWIPMTQLRTIKKAISAVTTSVSFVYQNDDALFCPWGAMATTTQRVWYRSLDHPLIKTGKKSACSMPIHKDIKDKGAYPQT